MPTAPRHSSAIVGQVCGQRCGSATRAVGDFTGLGCAVRARLRVYGSDGSGTLGGAAAEECITIDDAASFGSLFAVTAGVPDAVTVAMPATLGQGLADGSYVAEIALVAPGAADGCAIDGPFVALGRSAPFTLGADTMPSIQVPLGCHPSCLDLTSHDAIVAVRDIASLNATSPPTGAVVGDLFADQNVFPLDGQCAPAPTTPGPARFVAFGPSVQSMAGDGSLRLRGSFGADPNGGCVAVQAGSLLACIADLDAAPTIYVPDAALASAAVGLTPNTSAYGALLVVFLDGSGRGRQGVGVTGPGAGGGGLSAPPAVFPLGLVTSGNGLWVIPSAPPGQYSATMLGFGAKAFSAAAGAPGTLTTMAVVLP